MTIIFSKKCEYGIQAVLYLSTLGKGKMVSAVEISEKLKIPKEFVSKILQSLRTSKIVGSRKGNSGGFFLSKDPKKVKLVDIVKAIDGLEMFNHCILGFPNCSDKHPCPVHNKWGVLRKKAYEMLIKETLYSFKRVVINKMATIK
jgi:Rrf2 family protein